MQGGWLFLTRNGWPWAGCLAPHHWYVDGRFKETGRRLLGSTGIVYKVNLPHPIRTHLPTLLKINRFAQDAPVFFNLNAGGEQAAMGRGMRFLSSFEEFSLVYKLRASGNRTGLHPVRTQHPLGVYIPPTLYPSWKLGRKESEFWAYDRALKQDQQQYPEEKRITYFWDRVYISLFHWVSGIDAQSAANDKLIDEATMINLTRWVNDDLAQHGFAVADNKPLHIILRPNGKRSLLRHEGRPCYALIDYELLYRPGHPRPTAPALD
ncbi:MAG: hypothetical protein LR015_13320 [Verrucomicrobia bacterium]|nr:hypothetical protein [Verrucomicrobiota bacterium]